MNQREALPFRVQVLRQFNPVIAWVLRSRWHRLMSQGLLLLEYRGRKSGKAYVTPLAYVMHDGRACCMTRVHTSWWRNVVSAPSLTMWLRGERLIASAERAPSASPEARAAFVAFLRANPGTAKLLYKVRIGADGEPDANDVAREIHNSVVVRLTRH